MLPFYGSRGSEVGLGGSLGLLGHWSRRGGKMNQNHRICLPEVARPTISRERGEGGYHQVRSLRTKVVRHSAGGIRGSAPGPYTKPPGPLQPRAVWGKMFILPIPYSPLSPTPLSPYPLSPPIPW